MALAKPTVTATEGGKTVTEPEAAARYRKPGAVTRRLMNPFLVLAMRMGISVWGSRVLEVRGRSTGEPRRTPVNLLKLDGREYLVSPRGNTQWARNVRADNGRLVLELGRHRQERTVRELSDREKPPVLRAYLRRWKMEIGIFFDGVSADSSDEDLLRIAPKHPVFVLAEPQN
jgi:deazaflavin-dependent oxidoreductase (nitroreductase family)